MGNLKGTSNSSSKKNLPHFELLVDMPTAPTYEVTPLHSSCPAYTHTKKKFIIQAVGLKPVYIL